MKHNTMRIFISVDLPESLQRPIEDIESKINTPGIKLVMPELVHITIKFLGEVEAPKVSEICTALSQITCPPFEACIQDIGVFPKPEHIKVIWLGAKGNFTTLHQQVNSTLTTLGFPPDTEFIPHATIARVKKINHKTRRQLTEKLTSIQHTRPMSFTVNSLRVKKSTLTPQGPIYETICEIPLK